MKAYGGHLELSRAALAHNLAGVERLVAPAQVMAVLKANAYGAGAVGIARVLEDNSVTRFAVATVDEGVELRESGIGGDILCLTYFDVSDVEAIRHHRLTPTVFSPGGVSILNALAKRSGERVRVWVKVDTGLGRLGVPVSEAHGFIDDILERGTLQIAGVLSTLSENRSRDPLQLSRLLELRRRLEDLPGALWSIASSHGILSLPGCALDVVRPGVMLLGFAPSEPQRMDAEQVAAADLAPVVTWKTRVAGVKRVSAGEQVGYGERPALSRDLRVASLMVGWSDGYTGSPQAQSHVLIGAHRCPVVAQSANTTLVEVVPELSIDAGDEVVLLGRQGNAVISAEELARAGGGVYRMLAGIPARVPRTWM
jgi:alanine racemase